MENVIDYVDVWMKSQKDFMENWVKSQKDLMESFTEATKKLQESLMTMGGVPEGPAKEMFTMYNSWLTNLVNSSKGFSDEAAKIQDTWKNSVEKQMEMSRDMVKKMSEMLQQADAKK